MAGDFMWFELTTRDVARATQFYATVMGWTATPFDGSTMGGYHVLEADGVGIGGMMALSDTDAADCAAPGWLGYVGVDDVDAMAARATALGGAVVMPAADIPGVGRFALLADPQGAPFFVMHGDSDEASRAFEPATIGHAAWAELHTRDWRGAFDFYAGLFGWREADRMDMGPLGPYVMIDATTPAVRDGPCTASAAMFDSPDPAPPHWLFYFATDDIDAAAARIAAAGGTVTLGPQAIPGDALIVAATDPDGAAFALVGPRR